MPEQYKITVKRMQENNKWKVEKTIIKAFINNARDEFNNLVKENLINQPYIEPISITLSDGSQILSTFTIR